MTDLPVPDAATPPPEPAVNLVTVRQCPECQRPYMGQGADETESLADAQAKVDAHQVIAHRPREEEAPMAPTE